MALLTSTIDLIQSHSYYMYKLRVLKDQTKL